MTSRTRAAWAMIEGGTGPALGNIRVFETAVVTPAGAVLLAVDEDERRHMLVPISADERFVEDARSAGVHILDRELIDAGVSRRFADIVCRQDHLEQLFAELCDEMLSAIADDPSHGAEACLAVLQRWRELLESERSSLLGANALAGLCGELLVLEAVVAADPARRVDCWWGAQRDQHDFRRGATSVEVKTSTGRAGRFAEIHGIPQLEPPPDGELYLSWIRFDRVDAGGTSVPDLVERILAATSDRSDFVKRLDKSGYRLDDAAAYATIRFATTEQLLYRVDETFPRIVASSFATGAMPPGVVRVDYTIDLTGQSPQPLNEPKVNQVIRALGAGA